MTVIVKCPACRTAYRVPDQRVGAEASCKVCRQKFTLVVSADETAVPEATPPPSSSSPAPADRGVSSPGASGQSGSVSPSTMIGQYVVKRQLGAGGMGEVWLARDPYLDRDVAIKVLPAEFAHDDVRLQRFLREARLAAKIHHTNVATVYQAGVEGKVAFLAMELVEGNSLEGIVGPDKPMAWREATRVIRDAAAGLAAAHEIGLVHRDVKPSNLMRNHKGITKLLDFGLARECLSDARLTRQGGILGTPAYMSPEQWRGREADPRSDLYSLTCTYYYLLTGRDPFDAPLSALGYLHQHEPLSDPRPGTPGLPDAVCRILVRGSQKDPAARYQSAADLIAALDAVLAAPPEALTSSCPWINSPPRRAGRARSARSGRRSGTRCSAPPRAWRRGCERPSAGPSASYWPPAWPRRCCSFGAVIYVVTVRRGQEQIPQVSLEPESKPAASNETAPGKRPPDPAPGPASSAPATPARAVAPTPPPSGTAAPAPPPAGSVAPTPPPAATPPQVSPEEIAKWLAGKMSQPTQTLGNLRRIALAMHNHHDTFRTFPPAASRDKQGNPLLSWRVKLLPFLGEETLYNDVHQAEPWDSPHNKTLIPYMPPVYRNPARANDGMTTLMVFVGEGAPFGRAGAASLGPRLADITDGSGNTIMVVDAGTDKAVPWTKPEDLPFTPGNPLSALGTLPAQGFHAVFFDGATRSIPRDVDAKTLSALITPRGGDRILWSGLE